MKNFKAPETYQEAYHRAHFTEDPARAMLWHVISDYLARFIPSSSHVVELGAGYCYWINAVRASRKVAVDLWEGMQCHAASEVETVLHDLSLGLGIFGGEVFDTVLASNVLEHFDADVASTLVRDAFAALRPGGRFVIIQPNFRIAYRCYFDDYTHRAIFTDVSLPNLLRSHGFEIDHVQARFMPYSLKDSRVPIRPWMIKAYLRSPFKPFAGQMLVIGRKPNTCSDTFAGGA